MFTQITTFLASHAIQSIVWTSIIAVVAGVIIAMIKDKIDYWKDCFQYLKGKNHKAEVRYEKKEEAWQGEIRAKVEIIQGYQVKVKEHEATIAAFTTDRAIYISAKEDAEKARDLAVNQLEHADRTLHKELETQQKFHEDELLKLEDANQYIQKRNDTLNNENIRLRKGPLSISYERSVNTCHEQSELIEALYELIISLAHDLPEPKELRNEVSLKCAEQLLSKPEYEFYDTITSIQNGDKFLCVKDWVGRFANGGFLEGELYESYEDGTIRTKTGKDDFWDNALYQANQQFRKLLNA